MCMCVIWKKFTYAAVALKELWYSLYQMSESKENITIFVRSQGSIFDRIFVRKNKVSFHHWCIEKDLCMAINNEMFTNMKMPVQVL